MNVMTFQYLFLLVVVGLSSLAMLSASPVAGHPEATSLDLKNDGPVDCESPAATGDCKAHFEFYFFNVTSGQCDEFIYGGCPVAGNNNRYVALEICEHTCLNANKSTSTNLL